MLQHFREALRLDPANVDAGIRLLGHLADQDDWADFNVLARRMTMNSPLDARIFLFRGLGLHHVGRSDLAETAFETAFALMSAEELAAFQDIGALLHPRSRRAYLASDDAGRREVERIFFTATDPMYLTDVEERRMEVLIVWDYGCRLALLEGLAPDFSLTRNRTCRLATFVDAARIFAEDVAVLMPEHYRPRTITGVSDYAHQVARFRGSDPRLVRFEIYGAPPVVFLGVRRGDSLTVGLFLHDTAFRPVWQYRTDVALDLVNVRSDAAGPRRLSRLRC